MCTSTAPTSSADSPGARSESRRPGTRVKSSQSLYRSDMDEPDRAPDPCTAGTGTTPPRTESCGDKAGLGREPGPRRYREAVAILIDPPNWPAHGTLFSHLVSDVSIVELQAFADGNDVPRRAFDRDHYDVPVARYAGLVASGAREVSSRELLARLLAAGLRVRRSRSA